MQDAPRGVFTGLCSKRTKPRKAKKMTPQLQHVGAKSLHASQDKPVFYALRVAALTSNSDLEPIDASWELCSSRLGGKGYWNV